MYGSGDLRPRLGEGQRHGAMPDKGDALIGLEVIGQVVAGVVEEVLRQRRSLVRVTRLRVDEGDGPARLTEFSGGGGPGQAGTDDDDLLPHSSMLDRDRPMSDRVKRAPE